MQQIYILLVEDLSLPQREIDKPPPQKRRIGPQQGQKVCVLGNES